jgi:hypothetical protein
LPVTASADRYFEGANALVPTRAGADIVRPIRDWYYSSPRMNNNLGTMPWSFFEGLT